MFEECICSFAVTFLIQVVGGQQLEAHGEALKTFLFVLVDVAEQGDFHMLDVLVGDDDITGPRCSIRLELGLVILEEGPFDDVDIVVLIAVILRRQAPETLVEALEEIGEERALGVDERVHMRGELLSRELSVRHDD
jgi:hypothetical protein